MRKLTESEISVLIKCSAGIIDKEDVKKEIKWKASLFEIETLLDEFIRTQENNKFEAVFWNIPHELTKSEECILFRKYLGVNGHFEHENIVSAFQTYFNDDADNIKYLMNTINNLPDFYKPIDLKYPYIRKCIYAIGAQPEPNNFNALKILSESEDEEIKKLAIHQYEKRKKLGHWERK